MLSFENLVDLGCAAPHVYVMYQNISKWFTVGYLIAYKVLLTASHICFHQPLHYLPTCCSNEEISQGYSVTY